MPKYLIQASYTADATKALMKSGGTKRRAEVEEFFKSAGGRLEAFYFALGETDVYAIGELADAPTAAAMSMAANGSGAVQLRTTVLLTPEELDEAVKKSVKYRPPGT